MNKKVMALAVAGVLTAPAAFAQSSNVQLYGRANLGIDNYEATGARDQTVGVFNGVPVVPGVGVSGQQIDYKARMRVFDNSSRVGVRGTEDLGNGLKAIFQIETGVAVDSGQAQGAGGVGNGSKGTWASRDSFVGLDSRFGRLTFGRQSIYWANGELAQYAANYINTEIPWTNGTNLGRVSRNAAGATVSIARQSNTVQYTTPTFAGINATLSYSPNAQENVQHNTCIPSTNVTENVQITPEQGGSASIVRATSSTLNPTTGTQCAVGTGQNTDGNVWGATVRGAFGAFHGQVDYVQSQGNTPLSSQLGAGPTNLTQAEFKAWKAGIGWKYMPGANLSVIWVSNENNAAQGGPLGNVVKQQGWTINWEHTFGNIQALAQYGWTQDMKGCATTAVSCSDTSATGYMVGARYLLSKRTWIYASWNLVDNKQNNFSDYTGDAYTSVVNGGGLLVPYGADPQVWALGVFHAF